MIKLTFVRYILYLIVSCTICYSLGWYLGKQESIYHIQHIQGDLPINTYPITSISHVVDGDTFDCVIKLPLNISYNGRVRCKNYDAFETTVPKGKSAREYLDRLSRITKFYIDLDSKSFDTFGRVLGNVSFTNENGRLINLSEDMMEKGFVDKDSKWTIK